jgi:hypothetical protein
LPVEKAMASRNEALLGVAKLPGLRAPKESRCEGERAMAMGAGMMGEGWV